MSRTQRYKVRVSGVDHDVEVQLPLDEGPIAVKVDGHVHTVFDAPDSMMLVRSDDGIRQRTVRLEPGPKPSAAAIDGEAFALEVRTAQEAALEEALRLSGGAGASGASITAPMPGRVVRVLVSEGDEVELDQPLVIVEAMKMENEVRATSAGTVSTIAVEAGATVEAGQVMLEISAHADEP